MTGQALRGQHLEGVERAFRRLPDRYLGAEPGFDATYHVRLGDVGHVGGPLHDPRRARRFLGLFSDRDQIDPSVADVVVDEFQRIYGSGGARIAFLAAA